MARIVKFDEGNLQSRLKALRPRSRRLFALSCAERLFPLYQAYRDRAGRGNPRRIRKALDELWRAVSLDRKCESRGRAGEYESLIPDEDSRWTAINPLAENAVAALVYAIRCHVSKDCENAAWAAVQAYEAADYVAGTLKEIEFSKPGAESAILRTPWVQGELQSQLRDLAELERDVGDWKETVAIIRARARSQSQGLLEAANRIEV